MTQSGNPLDNAIAERVNGILKDEWLYQMRFKTKRSAAVRLYSIIDLYNNLRPHLSLGMQTPEQVHKNTMTMPYEAPIRLWKNYYPQKEIEVCKEIV